MSFDFLTLKEKENLSPLTLENKEQYYLDLMNIEHSTTGRSDAMFSNIFFQEAVQLIINSISLFEKGYFDCAFYSLRQSLEISTTIVYFVDDNESNRKNELSKWKNQDRFPMHNQMINELKNREQVFAEMKEKMVRYFEEIEDTKQKLNKYVHKQGFDKFYVWRNGPLNKNKGNNRLITDFESFLIKSIGAIAVFRLVIDPFPILLADESIYKRTIKLMTEGYSVEFIEKYIGNQHIESYKETDIYKSHYNYFITEEEMLPSVLDVVKDDFIDRNKTNEILTQKHLLSNYDIVAVALIGYSEKITKVYILGGFQWYFTNVQTKRTKLSWGSEDFKKIKVGVSNFNIKYDEAYLSYLQVWNEDFYIEHNEEFSSEEINDFNEINKKSTTHNSRYA